MVSGVPFAQFLSERLFVPLHMNSTGFYVPATARSSMVTMYGHDAAGALKVADWPDDPGDPRRWPSGGGGP